MIKTGFVKITKLTIGEIITNIDNDKFEVLECKHLPLLGAWKVTIKLLK